MPTLRLSPHPPPVPVPRALSSVSARLFPVSPMRGPGLRGPAGASVSLALGAPPGPGMVLACLGAHIASAVLKFTLLYACVRLVAPSPYHRRAN